MASRNLRILSPRREGPLNSYQKMVCYGTSVGYPVGMGNELPLSSHYFDIFRNPH